MIEKTTELHELECALEAVLFAAGDSVSEGKLCAVLQTDKATLRNAAQNLGDYYDFNRRGIKLLRLDDRYQLASRADYAQMVRNTLETRKPQNLTPAALEVLAIIAYKQPVTKTYIEQVRGVDSSYTVGMLAERGLIEVCGKLDVPGRPSVFRTTDVFLRTMGISELSQLPPLPDMTNGEGVEKLQNAIDEIQNAAVSGQMRISEVTEENGE